MKTLAGYLLIIITFATITGCSPASKTVKKIPEAQVRTTNELPANPTENELNITSIQGKYQLYDTTKIRVYLYVDVYKGKDRLSLEDFITNYNLNYVIYSDYGTRDRQGYGNVKLTAENVQATPNNLLITFDVKSPDRDYGVLLSEISQVGTLKKALSDLNIQFKKLSTHNTFAIYSSATKEPLQRHYLRSGEGFTVSSLLEENKPMHVYYYSQDFDAAASPMNTSPKNTSKSLVVDSLFTINTGETYRFNKEGLYNIFSDTTQSEGLGLLVVNERFPKITKPELLLDPLLYMSTNNEINEITKTVDYKKTLDKYWLTLMNGNAPLAQQSIRTFYWHVEEANRLFTTYKEGWKTDKGMIYIVLGSPDKVQE